MSGLAAICSADGRLVGVERLRRMTDAMAHRGPDGRGEWSEGPVALGHRLLFTTPASLAEAQPLADPAGACRIVWDGRLDNREELAARLGVVAAPGVTDPELVAAAYGAWGTGCPARLLGDFAFVLWDRTRRRLVCSRDRLGLKPLHYTWDGTTLAVSSEARPLAVALGAMPAPDDEFVLAFLLREFREPDNARTFYRGIRRLPPGHSLTLEAGTLRIERYWAVDPAAEVRYARDEDYVERFRELFVDAVRCRLRSFFPVGLFLSGGLDSAAITATAAMLGDGGGPGPPLEAFTFYASDRAADEREHARGVVGAAGLKGHELPTGERDPLGSADAALALETPILGMGGARDAEIIATVASRGCRVVLSGEGGDQLIDEIGYLADLLRGFRPLRFLRETRALADWYGGSAWELAGVAANCLVPGAVRYWGKRLLRGVPPPWMNPGLARAVGLRARVRSPRVAVRFPSFAQAETYGAVTSPYYVLKLEVEERYGARHGMEFRYPFLDSRLVEFVLAIPGGRRTVRGERKRILREAMRGIVAEPVRQRRGKGDWTGSMDRALVGLCRRDPPLPIANESGRMERYVDLRAAGSLVRRYLGGDRELRWEVWFLITLDRWLAQLWGDIAWTR